MCGRYVSANSPAELAQIYSATHIEAKDLGAQFNVAPTDPVYLLLDRPDQDGSGVERELRAARWGLVPSWAKDTKNSARLINARVETVAEKPSWRKPSGNVEESSPHLATSSGQPSPTLQASPTSNPTTSTQPPAGC